ncbi:hypothetical protein DYBT9275_02459 [Dyadobacter sp. CECT 9275]|uniref:Uncharacterized protein n=1 Tax=Dyadobacter helix TaxID=2822344 RepID=A0A916JFP3_9BACT|nr:hypothetical protein [Dyadobacter sp. CECT 9275]CAG5000416.1 hypothetical protein DYBT9275_02459 [Dyadobacter sp. CECT 9275]
MKTRILLLPLILFGILLASAYIAIKPAPAYKYTGAWQPSRISAADGITALDIKIGKFINLSREELAQVIFNVNNRFPGSKAWSFWAVGDMSALTPAHHGLTDAQHEAYLTYMDQLGVSVFLEIFPSKKAGTNVSAEIDHWLGKFKHHQSIAGLGIDLEYYEKASDAAAKQWDEKIKSHNAAYRLFLRHYDPGFMPPTYRGKGDLIFVDFASEATVEDLTKGFATWANRFAPTACVFQIGYPADEDGMNGSSTLGWWKLKDPIRDWGNMILAQVKDPQQELGLIWVTAQSGKSYHQKWNLSKGAKIPPVKK